MVITVKSSCIIVPANETPSGCLSLSECDQCKVWTLAPVVYVYKPNDSSMHASETLKKSLTQILVHYYPLAGRLRSIEGGRFEVDCNAMGALFLEAESEGNLDEFGDFRPGKKVEQLVPKLDYSLPLEEQPLVQLQLTKFSCGGLTFGVSISHMVADGWSALQFMNSWAKLARGKDIDVVPFHDRSVLGPSEPLIPPRFFHAEFNPWPLLLGQCDDTEERSKETSVMLLELTNPQIDKLRNIANEGKKPLEGRPYSRFEVYTGHLWKCVCQARASNDECQPTVLRTVGDCRYRLKQPLPEGYFGNTSFALVSPICLSGDLTTKPLSYAVQKVRETIEMFTDEYIKSALDFVKSRDDVSSLRASYHIEGFKKGPFLGNPNLSATSWTNLPIYNVDFGWGTPSYMTPANLVSDGKCFILPTPRRDGSVIINIRLQTQHIKPFKMFFYQDLEDC